jgi:hypothetical protein
MNSEPPLQALLSAAERGLSGEYVCSSADVQVHADLQSGRVAWATSSLRPFAFASHLREQAGIGLEVFRAVVEDCRSRGLPLGETLIASGLATTAQVRASLLHQIGNALRTLDGARGDARTLFFERVYKPYNAELTFDVRGVVSVTSSAPEAGTELAASPADATLQAASAGEASQVLASVDGVRWAETWEGGRVLEAVPSGGPRVAAALRGASLDSEADFVAVRSAGGSLLGIRCVSPSRSLWCRLEADSTFGAAFSALNLLAGVFAEPPLAAAPSDGEPWSTLGSADLGQFIARAPEVLAVFVLPAPGGEPLGCGTGKLSRAEAERIARLRSAVFREWAPAGAAGREPGHDSIGFHLKTLVTGEAGFWCFGAETAQGATSWLFLDRGASQGLGWAYLVAFVRVVTHVSSAA